MPSTGINRETGAVMSGLDHTRQSFRVIFSTMVGSHVMRRTFGSQVPGVLGRNLVPSTLALFWMAIAVAIDLWEPRLRLVQILYPAPPNAPAAMRLGSIAVAILADYRPNALEGDVTTDVQRIYI